MLVSKIHGTFWKLSKFQKYIYSMTDHKVDTNVLQCVYMILVWYRKPLCPWTCQWMAGGSAGFFLQCLGIWSWLTLGDNVEPRASAGERKGSSVTPFALACPKSQVRAPCCLLLLAHSRGGTSEAITLEEALLWKFRSLFFPIALLAPYDATPQ